MPDVNALADQVFAAVEQYLSKSIGAFESRIGALNARIDALPAPQDGQPGMPGPPGKDVDPEALASIERELVLLSGVPEALATIRETVAALPVPKDGQPGEPGRAGKDVDPVVVESLQAKIATLERTMREWKDDVIKTADDTTARLDEFAAIPKPPTSFFVNEAGDMVAVYPDGATKAVGAVRGKDGARGASVMDGSVDDAGQLILRMSDGRFVNVGLVRGKNGNDAKGLPGIPGRDATEVRPLLSIDEAKSYQPGTCALYRGGMILAERATDPIIDGNPIAAGWRVSQEGIAEETEQELDCGRFIERTTIYTSGRVFTRRIQSAAMIYKGTWADGDFTRGDTATWDGSLWHCERPTRDKPGFSPDWKLCAKRGTPGKDATRGSDNGKH